MVSCREVVAAFHADHRPVAGFSGQSSGAAGPLDLMQQMKAMRKAVLAPCSALELDADFPASAVTAYLVACTPQVDIDTVEKFETLRAAEQQYFSDMVAKCKEAGEHVERVLLLVWCVTAHVARQPSL